MAAPAPMVSKRFELSSSLGRLSSTHTSLPSSTQSDLTGAECLSSPSSPRRSRTSVRTIVGLKRYTSWQQSAVGPCTVTLVCTCHDVGGAPSFLHSICILHPICAFGWLSFALSDCAYCSRSSTSWPDGWPTSFAFSAPFFEGVFWPRRDRSDGGAETACVRTCVRAVLASALLFGPCFRMRRIVFLALLLPSRLVVHSISLFGWTALGWAGLGCAS